jgi:hypothetical protein
MENVRIKSSFFGQVKNPVHKLVEILYGFKLNFVANFFCLARADRLVSSEQERTGHPETIHQGCRGPTPKSG